MTGKCRNKIITNLVSFKDVIGRKLCSLEFEMLLKRNKLQLFIQFMEVIFQTLFQISNRGGDHDENWQCDLKKDLKMGIVILIIIPRKKKNVTNETKLRLQFKKTQMFVKMPKEKLILNLVFSYLQLWLLL